MDTDFMDEFDKVVNDGNVPCAIDDNQNGNKGHYSEFPDAHLNVHIGLPRKADNDLMYVMVKKRVTTEDGVPVGKEQNNPLLMDAQAHEVELIDGATEMLTANIIAENLLVQVDEDGDCQLSLDEIVDHQSNSNAMSKHDGFIVSSNSVKRKKMTATGWESCITWKDGSTDWNALKDIKASHPLACAKNDEIAEELAFAWWVTHALKRKNLVIKSQMSNQSIGNTLMGASSAFLNLLRKPFKLIMRMEITCGDTQCVKKCQRLGRPLESVKATELDNTCELNKNDTTMFQRLMEESWWAIEIRHVDVFHEVSVLSACQASPREGHLEQLIHTFAQVKKKLKLTLFYFDPQLPNA